MSLAEFGFIGKDSVDHQTHEMILVGYMVIQGHCPDADPGQRLSKAWRNFVENRYSDRLNIDFDPMRGWPGLKYVVLHTLSHLLIRTIALECGYNSASLTERIYAGEGRAGVLIYTAVPDSEGTLGGLVSLAEPDRLPRIVRRAMSDAQKCSGDPVCAEHQPAEPSDSLHGAACHACLFVSETTCEKGNRFLDRRFVVELANERDKEYSFFRAAT